MMANRLEQATLAIVALLAVIAIELALLLARPSPDAATTPPEDQTLITDELQQINGMIQQLCLVTYAGSHPSPGPDDPPDEAIAACGTP
jgi:hypothetical protein